MKKYQAVAFLLSTAMTVNSVAPVFGASSDILGHWAEVTITKWQNEGRIGGYEDGTFQPDKAVTRAEFVRLLNSAVSTPDGGSISFSDVKAGDWYYNDVAKAVGSSIASGFEDNTFRPSETVTRTQAAVFICNALKLTPNESGASTFTDTADIPSWAKGAVGAVVSAGFMSGYPDGSFGANKGMTRAEAVSTLDRVLGNGTSQGTPKGEIDTTERDKQKQEQTKTSDAGTMVWKGGGSGGKGSSSSSGGGGGGSSTGDYKNVTIRSQAQADNYSGKTLAGTTEIYITDKGIDLTNIKFDGDVDIYAKSSTAVGAAYAEGNTAVAAAYLADIDVVFEGTTGVTGRIRVISNDYINTQVVIKTRVPKKISKFIAAVAAKIAGFDVETVEAQAPIVISEGANIEKVEAKTGSSVEVEASADVNSIVTSGEVGDITLNGSGNTSVTVGNGSSVDNIALNGSAQADVKVEGGASVDKITLNDNSKADIDVKQNAEVDTIDSNSSATGTTITGTGNIDTITANNPDTINKNEEVETPITPTKPDTPVNPDKPTTPTTPTTKEFAVSPTTATIKVGGTTTLTVSNTPEGETVTWESSDTSIATVSDGTVTGVNAGTATITAKAGDKTATCEVTVEAPVATEITITPTSATVDKNSTATFTATVKDQFGEEMTGSASGITWEVKGSDGADYSDEGVTVTATANSNTATIQNTDAKAEATVTVTAKAGEKSASATANITTETAKVGKIIVTPSQTTARAGKDTVTCTKETQTAGGSAVTGTGTTTFSIDEAAKTAGITIDESTGALTITGYTGKGTDKINVTITATYEEGGETVIGTATVTVEAASEATTVEITAPTATEITAGDPAVTFTAKVLDQYDDEMSGEGAKVTWSVAGAQSATSATKFSGAVLTVADDEPEGKLTITATYTSGDVTKTATKEITVKAKVPEFDTFTASPNSVELSDDSSDPEEITLTLVTKNIADNEDITFKVTGGDTGTGLGDSAEATITSKVSSNQATATLKIAKAQSATTLTVTASYTGVTDKTVDIEVTRAEATATFANAEITGKVDEEITPGEEIIITLKNDSFNEINGGDDLSGWFTDLPEGITAKAKEKVSEGGKTVTVIIGGTPKTASADADAGDEVTVTVSADNVAGGKAIPSDNKLTFKIATKDNSDSGSNDADV